MKNPEHALIEQKEELELTEPNAEYHHKRRERLWEDGFLNDPDDPNSGPAFTQEYANAFQCDGCHLPLRLGTADGIDGKSYHSGCAVVVRRIRANQGAAA